MTTLKFVFAAVRRRKADRGEEHRQVLLRGRPVPHLFDLLIFYRGFRPVQSARGHALRLGIEGESLLHPQAEAASLLVSKSTDRSRDAERCSDQVLPEF